MFLKEKTIAVLTATTSANEERESVTGICHRAKELGWNTLVYNAQNNFIKNNTPSLDPNVFKLLNFKKISGVIISQNLMYRQEYSASLIEQCNKHNIPVMSLGYEHKDCYSYYFKNTDCMESIVDHLIEKHNCRTLNIMAGTEGNPFSETRITAFKRSLKKHGITFEKERLLYGDFWEVPAQRAIKKFLDSGYSLPDAVVCCNDVMAMAVISELNNNGYKVPDDIIVTGYDGVEFEQYSIPRLTTASCDYHTLGARTFDSLVKIIEGKRQPKVQTLEPQVVFSQSCGCQKENSGSLHNLSLKALTEIGSLRYLTTQMHKLSTTTSTANSLSEIKPILLNNGFHNPNCWILLNKDYENLNNLNKYTVKKPFSSEMDCFYTSHKYILEEHKSIKRSDLIPDLDTIIDEGITNLIIMDLFFGDESLGYIVGNFDATIVPLTNFERFSQGVGQTLSSIKSRLQLEHLTVRDILTGIYNRRGFYTEIKNRNPKKSKTKQYLIIHSIDMDELKYINDTFGHKEGDFAIRTLSKAIEQAGGTNSINARFGGDEFVSALYTSENPNDSVKNFKNKLNEILEKINKSSGKEYQINASIGSKWMSVDSILKIDTLIAKADEMMYNEKSSKKRKHPRK